MWRGNPGSRVTVDEPSVELARRYAGSDVEYIVGDFLSYPFPSGSFDLVASVAALHHMDTALALDRMRGLVRPGGQLVVLGLARSSYPADLPHELAAAAMHRLHRLTKPHWEHSAPKVWRPPQTYREVRRRAGEMLPGVRYRRHALWRYSLTWTKPRG